MNKKKKQIPKGRIVLVEVKKKGEESASYIGEVVYHNPSDKMIEVYWPSSFDCLFKCAPTMFEDVDSSQIKVLSGPMILEELGKKLHELRSEVAEKVNNAFANRRLAI